MDIEGLNPTKELENHVRVLESAIADLIRETELEKASAVVSCIQINGFQLMTSAFIRWASEQLGKSYLKDVVPVLMPVAKKEVGRLEDECRRQGYPDWLTKSVVDGVNHSLDCAERESREAIEKGCEQ